MPCTKECPNYKTSLVALFELAASEGIVELTKVSKNWDDIELPAGTTVIIYTCSNNQVHSESPDTVTALKQALSKLNS